MNHPSYNFIHLLIWFWKSLVQNLISNPAGSSGSGAASEAASKCYLPYLMSFMLSIYFLKPCVFHLQTAGLHPRAGHEWASSRLPEAAIWGERWWRSRRLSVFLKENCTDFTHKSLYRCWAVLLHMWKTLYLWCLAELTGIYKQEKTSVHILFKPS